MYCFKLYFHLSDTLSTLIGPCKVQNETKPKQNETKEIETKRNKSKRNETKPNESKQTETNPNETKRMVRNAKIHINSIH